MKRRVPHPASADRRSNAAPPLGDFDGIILYKRASFSAPSHPMRLPIFVASAVFLGAAVVHGQEQERKLMDRILKPDMTLKNSAQDKQFTAAGNSAPTKSVKPKMFHFLQRSRAKEYTGVKNVETRQFATRKSSEGDRAANLTTRNVVTE